MKKVRTGLSHSVVLCLKKQCIALFFILALLHQIGSVAAAQISYSESEIIAICKDAASKEGIPIDELDSYQAIVQSYTIDTHGIITQKWLVTFQESSSPEAPFVFAIFTAPQGIILTTNRDRAVFSLERQRLEWETQKGLFQFWSVEDKAAFNQQVNVPLGYGSSSRMPDDPAIGQDEALLMAKNAIMEKYALTEVQVDQYLVELRYLESENKLSWLFAYHVKDQTRQAFFPIEYTVVIDSENGSILDVHYYGE